MEVSLSPCGIIAPCMPPQGQRDAWIAPACAIVAPPRSPLRRAGDCTCNTAYSIVKVRQGRIFDPFNNQDNF